MTADPAPTPHPRHRAADAAWIGLFLALVAAAWWRAHTFAPTLIDRTGLPPLWPVVAGATEPLDCDEAAYAYMGRRLNAGALLYRDLAENKPPLGYWLFALATRLGGASEWTVRLTPLPFVLGTMGLLWWIARDLVGPLGAIGAALLYALLSTDPYIYGNGMQLEQPINLLSTAALAALLAARRRGDRLALPTLAGALVAAATLIRPTSAVLLPFLVVLLPGDHATSFLGRARPALAVSIGLLAVLAASLAALAAQGVLAPAWENTILAARALVADTPPPPHVPPWYLRWLTGNSDPRDGSLPWPFGATDWLVWWGRGAWPLWLFATIAIIGMAARSPRGDARRALAAWTLAAWLQVVLPRQYWPHYYLLPTPPLALGTTIALADAIRSLRAGRRRAAFLALLGAIAITATFAIQVRDYLLVPASELTARYKGGRQWIALRQLGAQLAFRARGAGLSGLQVWGWQSPLYLYSGLDAPSRHFFNNDLVKTHIDAPHPLVDRWKAELLADLERQPPAFVFCGDHPFAALRAWLEDNYIPSNLVRQGPRGEGLWLRKGLRLSNPMPQRLLRVQPRRRFPPVPPEIAVPATTL
jgi:4-amino-4-deoxy-L-arabinose transferase-like glycosyltransferase